MSIFWQEIIISIIFFTAVVLLLAFIIIFFRKLLIKTADVDIDINSGEKVLKVKNNHKLLFALADHSVLIPSGCGGKGTCGQCKLQVYNGGGTISPIEENFINVKSAKDHYRLSCQVTIKKDLKIGVPQDVLGVKKSVVTVKSNKNKSTFIKELVLILDSEMKFKAGQYIQIDVPRYASIPFKVFDVDEKYRSDWDYGSLFNLVATNHEPTYRAYSMANYPGEKKLIKLNVRIAMPPPRSKHNPGVVSSYIFSLKPGDKITISGPYGDFFAQDNNKEMVFLGGGAGMAPLRSIIFDELLTKNTNRKISYWYGARSKKEIFYDEDFKELARKYPNFSWHVALSSALPEDHWDGYKGFIHQVAYDHYLSKQENPEDIEYYLCGPGMMIKAVQKMLDNLGVDSKDIKFDDFG